MLQGQWQGPRGVGEKGEHLTSALSHTDDTVALVSKQAPEVGHEALLPIHGKVDLRDQAHVHHPCHHHIMSCRCFMEHFCSKMVCSR